MMVGSKRGPRIAHGVVGEGACVDGYRFDRMTRRLAGRQHSRRAALRAGFLGLAATAVGRGQVAAQASGTPAAEGTPTIVNANEIEVGGMWFCNQTFALCTTAPCELSQSDPTIANCHCVVENAYSIGNKTCPERAQSGTNLVSNFSTVNVNSEFAVMMCPEDAPWANCLDVPCEIDTFNPAVATCQCVMVETGPSLTFGGGCDTSTCTSTIWSAAPTNYIGLAQYEEGMKAVNQTVTLPEACPAGTPVATPSA
jgi:hypothetical protein